MSVPVTNEAYSQQNNQIFDWAKTATPQQIEVAKRGLPKDSPLLLAIGMGVQYQQQTRAPNPQAPQKTVMEQKLGEFTQTSSQGLPQVGQNQMAMQQTAQQNPMFGAGLAVAPENTEQAPAPQQMAATGGITALAHGGEVRGFEEGGSLDALTALADKEEGDEIGNEGRMFENFAKQAKNTGTDLLDKYKAYTNTAPSAGLPSINLGGDPSSPTGAYKAPTLDTAISDMGVPTTGGTSPKIKSTLSDFETAPKTKPKVKAHHSKKDTAPAPGSSAEANAASPTAKGETYQSLDKYLSKGVVNPNAYDADSVVSNMLNKDTTPHLTAEESIANIQKLLGSEADMSEEVGMAREAAANASRDKGLGALIATGAGMLSAKTPYMGQAVGAGLMSGLSAYQQGAKEQGTADKELMALQMAQKKSDLAGHRTAAEMYIGAQTKAAEKAAEANATAAGLRFGLQGDLIKGKQRAGFEQEQQATKQLHDIDMATQAQIDKLDLIGATGDMKLRVAKLSPAVRQQLLTTVYNRANKEGMDTTELQTLLDEAEKFTYQTKSQPKGMGQSLAPLGSSGVFYSPKK
jgi:hypothetical protein